MSKKLSRPPIYNNVAFKPQLLKEKGLPVTPKIALLDTTFKEYLIEVLVTILINGSVILMISPNFTIRLTDPKLAQRIKIQVQLIGVTQDASAEQATLQHQVLYRVQDHALDLNLPNFTEDALLMFTDKNHGLAIVNIPIMITTEELSTIVHGLLIMKELFHNTFLMCIQKCLWSSAEHQMELLEWSSTRQEQKDNNPFPGYHSREFVLFLLLPSNIQVTRMIPRSITSKKENLFMSRTLMAILYGMLISVCVILIVIVTLTYGVTLKKKTA
ncbi:polyprotein [Arachis hypogaea]|nr:polyprotein [Arachis hypogaea]